MNLGDRQSRSSVIPAQAGIHGRFFVGKPLDSRFRGNDEEPSWPRSLSCVRPKSNRQALTSALLFTLLALPPLRQPMEASMAIHMLLQLPLLAVAGALMAAALPKPITACLQRHNRWGLSGLLLAAFTASFWMLPRALDEALASPLVDAAKFASLALGVGVALRLSWRSCGLMGQGLFLGNLLPMMAVVGWLYLEAPVRVCNYYLTDQQASAGRWLIAVAIAAAGLWLLALCCGLGRPDQDSDNFSPS